MPHRGLQQTRAYGIPSATTGTAACGTDQQLETAVLQTCGVEK